MKGINAFDDIELSSLRGEIVVRILIQNITILVTLLFFYTTLILIIVGKHDSGLVSLAYCLASGASALCWCHNGVRQAQIKSYLLLIEARSSPAGGWESWLPRNRIGGWLGTRWLISTKGVFIGSQLIAAGSSQALAAAAPVVDALLLLTIAATALVLLINPKERGAMETEGERYG